MAFRTKLRDIKSAIQNFVDNAIEKAYDMAQEQKNLYASPILNFAKGFDVDAEKKMLNEYNHKFFGKEVEVPNGIQEIKMDAFADSRRLEGVILPPSVVNVQDRAFQNCEKLQWVALPEPKPNEYDFEKNGKDEGIRRIRESTFENCHNLQLVNIPYTVEKIESNAFRNCENLFNISADISKAKNLDEIGDSAFHNCKSLTELKMPDSVKILGAGAFYGCESLKKLTLSDNLQGIEASAFQNCKSLEKLNIPESVKHIEENAFKNCENLKSITVSVDLNLNGDAFKNCLNLSDINVKTENGLVHLQLPECKSDIALQKSINEISEAMGVLRNPDVKLDNYLSEDRNNTYVQTAVALANLDSPKAQEFVQEHIAEALYYCKEYNEVALLNNLKDNFEYTKEDVELALEARPIDVRMSSYIVQESLVEMKWSAPEAPKIANSVDPHLYEEHEENDTFESEIE